MTARSIKEAIDFSKQHMPDAFLAVGGGSVIDTAKLMNLYTSCPSVYPKNVFLLILKPIHRSASHHVCIQLGIFENLEEGKRLGQ